MQKLCSLCKTMIPKEDEDVFQEATTWTKTSTPVSQRAVPTGKYAHGGCVRGDNVPKLEVVGQEPLPLDEAL